jgi:formate dehydrogenase iron-sulfur subunit
MVASRENFPLLAELLADQQRLDTPVARFATAHDAASPGIAAFAPQLIPLTKPQPGEQYAFEVDLDSCTGCKSCVAACHSLNGLDDEETWRDVGLVVSPRRAQPFSQTVTTACHHCADPACLNGCPVLAYEKDPITGIVRHLDDQCIGCSYCVLKCPYDVPKFSDRLGIVRKCDMCHGRLAAGEAPACAQACPTHAIRIVTVPVPNTAHPEVATRTTADVTPLVSPSALRDPHSAILPNPSYTRPTTRYVTRRKLPENLIAGDAATLRVQPGHLPLVVMLTLIPVAVGLAVAGALPAGSASPAPARLHLAAAAVGAVGLVASVFHLGQPLRAWRIFLGWRKSWLSREAMLFGAWFGLAAGTLMVPGLAPASAGVGLLGLACSAMIYVDTQRSFWRASQTFPRFFGTAAIAALALVAPLAAALALGTKVAWESRTWFNGSLSARLQRGPLRHWVAARDGAAVGAILLLVIAPGPAAWLILLMGELLERSIFFRAVDAPKMPGLPSVAATNLAAA